MEEVALCAESLQGRLLEAAADWAALLTWMQHVRIVALDHDDDEADEEEEEELNRRIASSLPSDDQMERVRALLSTPPHSSAHARGVYIANSPVAAAEGGAGVLLHGAIASHLGDPNATPAAEASKWAAGGGRVSPGGGARTPPFRSLGRSARQQPSGGSGSRWRSGGGGGGESGGGTAVRPLGSSTVLSTQGHDGSIRGSRASAGSRFNSGSAGYGGSASGSRSGSISPGFSAAGSGRRKSGAGGGGRSRSPYGNSSASGCNGSDHRMRSPSPGGAGAAGDGLSGRYAHASSPVLLGLAELSPLAMRSARNSGLPLKQQVHQLRVAWSEMRHAPGRSLSKAIHATPLATLSGGERGALAALACLDVDWNGEEEPAEGEGEGEEEAEAEAGEEEEDDDDETTLMDSAEGRAKLAAAIQNVVAGSRGSTKDVGGAKEERSALLSPAYRQVLVAVHDPPATHDSNGEDGPCVWILRRCVLASTSASGGDDANDAVQWQASRVELTTELHADGGAMRLRALEWYGSETDGVATPPALAVLWEDAQAAPGAGAVTLSLFDVEMLPAVTVADFVGSSAASVVASLSGQLVRVRSYLLLSAPRTLSILFVSLESFLPLRLVSSPRTPSSNSASRIDRARSLASTCLPHSLSLNRNRRRQSQRRSPLYVRIKSSPLTGESPSLRLCRARAAAFCACMAAAPLLRSSMRRTTERATKKRKRKRENTKLE